MCKVFGTYDASVCCLSKLISHRLSQAVALVITVTRVILIAVGLPH